MADPVSERRLKDSDLTVNIALPNAANTVNTNVIDLGSNTPYSVTEGFHVKLSTTTATGANNKNINIRLAHSNESNANFTNITELGLFQVVDNNGAGFSAGSMTVQLPPGVKRYVRGTALGEANGGNAADGTLTVQLMF